MSRFYVITPAQAANDNISPDSLRAVARWNISKRNIANVAGKRRAGDRHHAQAMELRRVANVVERGRYRAAA